MLVLIVDCLNQAVVLCVLLRQTCWSVLTKFCNDMQKGQGDQHKSNLARDASQQLVSVALQRGTADNVTAIVMLPQWS